jgi:UDP-N-acetylglucosamine 2-epimerase (non-hydrolysing)
MKKVLISFGTRPEAIKMAPLYFEFKKFQMDFETILCVTGQHKQMVDQVLDIFDIKPDVDLKIMSVAQDLFDITTLTLDGMRSCLASYKPDYLFIHGDTTSALSASLAGFYSGVPNICHIEAGLRTYDVSSPYPEELNRQVISKIANIHFSPTKSSEQNLLNEGVPQSNICVTGNTVIDALFFILRRLEVDSFRKNRIVNLLNTYIKFNWLHDKFILITAHRRENFGNGILEICHAIARLANEYPHMHLIYPVHLNPNVKNIVSELLIDINNIFLIPPLDYESFTYLLSKCHIVLTDSGGIQEEAPSLGKPVLVMRNQTERPEAIEAGNVRLVGAKRDSIFNGVSELLTDNLIFAQMSGVKKTYGNGDASFKIVSFIRNQNDE